MLTFSVVSLLIESGFRIRIPSWPWKKTNSFTCSWGADPAICEGAPILRRPERIRLYRGFFRHWVLCGFFFFCLYKGFKDKLAACWYCRKSLWYLIWEMSANDNNLMMIKAPAHVCLSLFSLPVFSQEKSFLYILCIHMDLFKDFFFFRKT